MGHYRNGFFFLKSRRGRKSILAKDEMRLMMRSLACGPISCRSLRGIGRFQVREFVVAKPGTTGATTPVASKRHIMPNYPPLCAIRVQAPAKGRTVTASNGCRWIPVYVQWPFSTAGKRTWSPCRVGVERHHRKGFNEQPCLFAATRRS